MRRVRPLHAGAWLVWITAVILLLTATRNPWYLGLCLLWIGVTHWAVLASGHALQSAGPLLSPLRFGLLVIPVAALLNALFVHVGEFRLMTLPTRLPLIGGPITLEALSFGALNGIVLTGLFAAFAVLNLVTPVHDLIQLTPRAYYPVAVTLAIAVTFVPVTLRQADQIREAQAVRGHRLRGLRSWLPLFLPLLSSGLERALTLAEAMVARGFAAQRTAGPRSINPAWTQALLLGSIVLLGGGWLLRLVWQLPLVGSLAMIAGAAAFLLALWLAGRNHPHTVYRPLRRRRQEWAVSALGVVAAALFLLPLPGLDRSSLGWYPYPALSLPGFAPLLGLGTWALLAPAVLYLGSPRP